MTVAREIVPLAREHWPAVRAIFHEGIEAGNATFETSVPDWDGWDRAHRPDCRFVALEAGVVVAWAALSPVSARAAYGGVAEVSIYVTGSHHGRGIGRALLAHLVEASEAAGIWTLQATVFPENAASVTLHRGAGFREVGRRERVGCLRGQWRDTVVLERRSARVGA